MGDFLLASAVIFFVLVAWQLIEYGYRRFARRHPGLGPYRPEAGCGDCACGQGGCSTPNPSTTHSVRLDARPVRPAHESGSDA
jgi:hypothetical protein